MSTDDDLELNDPWLIAAWPGMGSIAQIAGRHLVHSLGARLIASISPDNYFDLRSVRVNGGLIQPLDLPSSLFFGWKNPGNGRDLVIFLGEEQPSHKGYSFCDEVLSVALQLGVKRVFTFAAMATPIRTEATPRVFAATSQLKLLEEVNQPGIEVLKDAVINGLNGILLAAAAECGLGAVCLLGEFPFFASSFPNPKASAAVLRTFADLAEIDVDLTQLDMNAVEMERMLAEIQRRLELTAHRIASDGPPRLGSKEETEEAAEQPEVSPSSDDLDDEARARIEALFKETERDRAKALQLKAELDRHGVFGQFEDRFLDLFKQAE